MNSADVESVPSDPVRAALEWYRDEAEALARSTHVPAVLASLTVLSIDGGARARAALAYSLEKP